MATIYSPPLRPDDICHFGVLGMKWGVRRYQNPDGSLTEAGKKRYNQVFERKYTSPHYRTPEEVEEDVKKSGVTHKDEKTDVLKKGSKLQRRAEYDELNDNNPKYMSVTKSDNYEYATMSPEYLGIKDVHKDSVKEYTLKRDINIANAKTTTEHLLKQIGDKPIKDYIEINPDKQKTAKGKQTAKDILKYMGDIPVKEFIKSDLRYYNSVKPDMQKEFGRDVYLQRRQKAMAVVNGKAMKTFMQDHTLRDKVIKDLKAKGYDAMVDIEDYVNFEYPIIVFNPKKVSNITRTQRW